MICLILQVRLDSTRLPQKALLNLAGKPVIVRVMENLRRVHVDRYVLACDTDSESVFAPLAAECGFTCISGPKEDVLERFCLVIRRTGADTVLRATGDNPFLFADAATASLERFAELRKSSTPVDYFTYTGLPHGSGIEVFSARRLLEAAVLTDSAWDHEHVGPAFYNHEDRFVCIREPAPEAWYFPSVRTTIDTREDYDRACLMVEYLMSKRRELPVSSSLILDAWRYVTHPLLLVPAAENGQGTGHIRRLADLYQRLHNEWRCLYYLPRSSTLLPSVPSGLRQRIVHELPASAHLVILDRFRTSPEEMLQFRSIGPVLALDEGGNGRNLADYLLDIIPGLPGRLCPPNRTDPAFLPLPRERKRGVNGEIRNALVLAGGENACGLALPAARALASMDLDVTVIDPSEKGLRRDRDGIAISGPVPGLRETLCHYDLVVTHYGFTAFEAIAAGCRVILFSPSRYHYRLAREYGFSVVSPRRSLAPMFRRILMRGISVPAVITPDTVQADLGNEIVRLAGMQFHSCPLCGVSSGATVLARYPDRTVLRCPACGIIYPSFQVAGARSYKQSYFFEEYRSQYGKTYLEDFPSIRRQGEARLLRIGELAASRLRYLDSGERWLLDIGCAYGPFLDAAREAGWMVQGTDISEDAVRYVTGELKLPAVVSAFPAPDRLDQIASRRYAVVTLWYVIEHFEDLSPVLERIGALLVPGGILAFSTPSAAGVSARFSPSTFYRMSPVDHFTIWDPRRVRKQLARYGFRVLRIVSTGHHPERFPGMKKNGNTSSISWKFCLALSRLFRLGDTFEVYAMRNGKLEDAL